MRKAQNQQNQNGSSVYVPQVGDIIVKNSVTNETKVLPYSEWIQLEDSWDIQGIYGVATYEEENAENGYYVIMSNGVTLIIAPEDFNKVSNNWEQVDTIIVTDSYNTHDYVEIGGIKWATMNVGANSVTDTGLYFQWGDTQGYTASQVGSGEGQKYFSEDDCIYYNDDSYTKYNEGDSLITLESTDDAVKAAWGSNWRMPTVSEFIALGTATTSAWTADYQGSGVAGVVLTSNADGATLFFPACGDARYGSVLNVGNYGYYWSSSLSADCGDISAYRLYFNNGGVDWDFDYDRFGGCPVRGVLDE